MTSNQDQTRDTFAYKWQKRSTFESPHVLAEYRRWLLEKYFDSRIEGLDELLSDGPLRILDAGCGAGLASQALFGDELHNHEFFGVDISDSIETAKLRFRELGLPASFLQHDLMNLPEHLGDFDIIFSEGVLHHTDSVRAAISAMSKRLSPGGLFLFYVYRKKAPIREFSDDHIRSHLAHLSNEEAWDALLPLTRLGEALGRLEISINVPEDIPLLGIQKGEHKLQRLLYYTMLKSWYHEDFTVEEMNHINFDWFRPTNCHRHSPAEVQEFVAESGLQLRRIHEGPSGITVIAQRLG